MSSGVPSAHAANAGDASRPLSRRAKACRSAGGKKVSRSNTPSLRSGGCSTWPTSVGEVEAASLAPRRLDEVGQEDELARREGIGGDAHQAEQAGDEALDLVAHGLDVARVGGCLERADQVHRHAGGGARGVDREAHAVVEGLEALGPDGPAGQTLPPGRGLLLGEQVGRETRLLGVALVDPGAEVGRRQLGEQQEQVGQITLGIDEQAGHARREALLDQHDAEARLARTRHPHDHAVGGEVAAREGDGGVGALVGGRVDHRAEGQVSHPGNVGPGQGDDLRPRPAALA